MIMKRAKRRFMTLFTMGCFILLMICFTHIAEASADFLPTAVDNLDIGLRRSSGLAITENGYMRVFYDGSKIGIEYYDMDFDLQSRSSLDMELSIWGGFYAGPDAYYLVEGQNNTAEDDTAEVIRVIKYDTGWNRIGAAAITGNPELFGGEVRYPFDYGCVEMTENNGILYIVTGHEGYVDPAYNQGHQGFLMIAVDETSMTGQIVVSDLWHSFAQYISSRDSDLYVLEQSEGSRYTELSRYNTEDFKGTSLPVFKYGGSRDSAWAISCYASVDGMALSSDNVLCLGTSIDQSEYDNVSSDTEHNIYLTVTPMSDFSENATTVKWLTNYRGGGKCFLGAKITKINDDRFMISWEEFEAEQSAQTASEDDSLSSSILHYLFIDGAGNPISPEYTAGAPISDCQPILDGSRIVYYGSSSNMVDFYSIDTETGAFNKKVYRVAGENAAWDLKEGTLTISGTGEMSVDTEVHFRHPVSSTSGGFSYSSSDNTWLPVREYVTKIVIDSGITSIPESAFGFFDNLREVEIRPGLERIGAKAFYSCESLSKITIPASVTSIGEDFLWTGSYWIHDHSHVVHAAIYAPKDSYAMEYARANGIAYENPDRSIDISKAVIRGVKEKYPYTGRVLRPRATVVFEGETLQEGTDYRISYGNNKNTGKASIKIKGIGRYSGTLKTTFRIVPKRAAISRLTSPRSKTVKVTWKKDTQADGYQIQYARNSKFTDRRRNIPVTKKSTVTKKISRLSKNKTFYVRVRAYKKIGGNICYGSWSRTAKVRCK